MTSAPMRAQERVIVALDEMDLEDLRKFLPKIAGHLGLAKIGMEAFYAHGKDLVLDIHHKYRLKIFLDLKLHDIPNTVSKAIKSLRGLPLEFLTLHLAGGRAMVGQALLAAKEHLPQTKLLGVTYLTSLGAEDFREMWNYDEKGMRESFKNLVRMGEQTGLPGLVLSVHELPLVKEVPLIKVCPGIRFPGDQSSDQKRVETPQEAFRKGADYLVIGRSLTKSSNLDERLSQIASLQGFGI